MSRKGLLRVDETVPAGGVGCIGEIESAVTEAECAW